MDEIQKNNNNNNTNHAIPGHRRRGRVVNVGRLEDDLAARGHRDPVTVGQRQGSVVIEDGVQVLDPDGVDRPVQDQPDVLACKCTSYSFMSLLQS